MTTTSESERLRRAISLREFPTSRLSAELRAQATSYVHRRAAAGAAQSLIAAELGVSVVSVSRWLRATSDRAALVPVSVIADVVESTSTSTYEVVTPRGLRVVGLDIGALCTLLERHG